MSAFEFRPAVRSNLNLLIGIAGASGAGKTFSAFRLASGICGDKPFAVIDTENGRASHYAGQFRFDVAEIHAPFSPRVYTEAILAADAAGYKVIVVDSFSHSWAGDGGTLDMQEQEFIRMGSKEGAKVASWIRPKAEYKKMMTKLLQVKADLILCFRAEQKIEIIREDGKTKIVPKQSLTGLDGWIPISEKSTPYELTASFLLTPDAPGMPKPIKLQEQHRPFFPLDKPITEESGRRIAEWASGGTAASTVRPPLDPRHATMIENLERLARDEGFHSFKAIWEALEKEDKAAIGRGERDRIGAIGQARDAAGA